MSIKHISRIIILALMVMLGVKSRIPIVNASAGVRAESGVSKTNTSSRSLYKQDSIITGENNLEFIIKCLISKDCIAVIDEDLRKKLKVSYDDIQELVIGAGVTIPPIKCLVSEDCIDGVDEDLRKKLKVSYDDITDLAMEAAVTIPPIKGDPIDEDLKKKLKEHYDKMQSYKKSISRKKQEVAEYQELLRISNSNGATDNKDYYHDVEVNVMEEYGVSQREAHQMIESRDPRVDIVWKKMVDAKIQQDLAQLRARRSHIKNNESRKE